MKNKKILVENRKIGKSKLVMIRYKEKEELPVVKEKAKKAGYGENYGVYIRERSLE